MKKFVRIILALLACFGLVTPTNAIEDPRNVPNNRFGIHIIDENDLSKAAELVNGSGGAWGYVTIVMREDDRNKEKWQSTFDKMREMKLIPIIRLATSVDNAAWKKADYNDIGKAREWAEFLNSLNWVVKNRYVILFNEPNHAKEWGGTVAPSEYAKTIRLYRDSLKAVSGDFFVLVGGLDLAAEKTVVTMPAPEYYKKMYETDNEIFKIFDGLASHSYPNPNFSGNVWATGQKSIRGFEWEINYLRQYGLPENIPVFITETGWAHSDGKNGRGNGFKNSAEVANDFKNAFESVWNGPNIVAVTPFILNYQDKPFDHFSWIKEGGVDVYPQYETVKNLPKTGGVPVQIISAETIVGYFPSVLATDSNYKVAIRFKNNGQNIWENDNVVFKVTGDFPEGSVTAEKLPKTVPGATSKVWIEVDTEDFKGDMKIEAALWKGEEMITQPLIYEVKVEEASLIIKLKLIMERVLNGGNLIVMFTGGWNKLIAFLVGEIATSV